MKRLLIVLSAFCVSSFVLPAQILAQSTPAATISGSTQVVSPINLTISPVSLALETEPGTPVITSIKVRNNSQTAEQLNISFGTFKADPTGQHPELIDPKPEDEFMKWLTADPGSFTLKPGEWQTISITFAPPSDAALSYYYTIMINRAAVPTKPGETVIQGAPAVLVLSNVKSPNAKRQLELGEFKATHPFLEYLPESFEISVKNTGNVHVAPAGNIFIDGQGKKDLAVLSINPNNSAVLPQSSRTLETTWDDGFPMKLEKGSSSSEPGFQVFSTRWDLSKGDRFRFGKYTAHLLMVYDNGERDVPIESFVSFWVIPWKLLLVCFFTASLVLLGLRSVLLSSWRKIRSLGKPTSD